MMIAESGLLVHWHVQPLGKHHCSCVQVGPEQPILHKRGDPPPFLFFRLVSCHAKLHRCRASQDTPPPALCTT